MQTKRASLRLVLLTLLAMVAFAGNSILCRLALQGSSIDATSFTSIRMISGALVLWFIVRARFSKGSEKGSWLSAISLYVYAGAFSLAYLSLPTGTGALLLFGAVQTTMVSHGLWKGERLQYKQTLGLLIAVTGLMYLVWPGVSAPSVGGSILMICAGVAWGIYSLRGRRGGDATTVTAGNFMRTVPFVLLASALFTDQVNLQVSGVTYALLSGTVTSGIGYSIWYAALPQLRSTTAATVQLGVPLLAAVGGGIVLGEPLTLRLAAAAALILGGMALVIFNKKSSLPN